MRSVVQRVDRAEIRIAGKCISRIKKGILVFLGIQQGDEERDADYLCDKIIHLRIFEDDKGKINLSLLDIKGEMLMQLFSHARLFVLPSYHEGLPISLLEAMSYSLPVLVSDIPANLQVNLPENRYFKTGNMESLSEKLKIMPGNFKIGLFEITHGLEIVNRVGFFSTPEHRGYLIKNVSRPEILLVVVIFECFRVLQVVVVAF